MNDTVPRGEDTSRAALLARAEDLLADLDLAELKLAAARMSMVVDALRDSADAGGPSAR